MPSLGHVAVGVAAGRLHAGADGPRAAATAVFTALATIPDLDVLARALGAGAGSPWLHRGASHSLAAAVLAASLAALWPGGLGRSRARLGLTAALVAASHGALDAVTRGGPGVMLLWPASAERLLAPWTLVGAAPMGLRLVSPRGLRVLLEEALIFAPLLLYGLWPSARPGRPAAADPPTDPPLPIAPTAPTARTRARAAPRPRRGARRSSG